VRRYQVSVPAREQSIKFLFFIIHIFTCAYTGSFLPPVPAPSLFPTHPHFQAEPVLPFYPILFREDISNN
jgi:hypothetical protein